MPFGMTDAEFSRLSYAERERLVRADQPKGGKLVKWERTTSAGVRSKCGRFDIEGEPEGTTRNQSYSLYELKDGKRVRRITNGSMRSCKVSADRVVEKERAATP